MDITAISQLAAYPAAAGLIVVLLRYWWSPPGADGDTLLAC